MTDDRWKRLRSAIVALDKKAAQKTGDCGPGYQHPYFLTYAQAAADCARELLAECDALAERADALAKLIEWTLGEGDDFPDWPETVTIKGNPKFWWRRELRRRYDNIVFAAPTPK